MTLTISDTQARVLIAALDHYSRMGMGQLWTIAETLAALHPKQCHDQWELRDRWIAPMQMEIFGMPINASMGICAAPERARIAYDLQCVIRRPFARSESDVWHGEPLHTCKTEPLAKVAQ